MTTTTTERRSPWLVGIIIAIVVVVAINVAFIVIAVRGSDPVVPSYSEESR
jgi:anti-sigma-K factor RskA